MSLRKQAVLVVFALLTAAFDTPHGPPIAAKTGGAAPAPASAGGGPAPQPEATCHLNYYGGKVLQNVVVEEVNWGTGVNATVQSTLGGFYAAVTASAYFDWLSEYNTVGLNGMSDGLPGS